MIVDHNTSPFAELALRPLDACTTALDGEAVLRITVADNHSDDDGLDLLRQAASALGARFEQTRWPRHKTVTNSHGDVLRDFVLSRVEADAFLFVDADVVWTDPGSVRTMVDELTSAQDVWAVQARFHWAERHRGRGTSGVMWAGRPITMQFGSSFEGNPRPARR